MMKRTVGHIVLFITMFICLVLAACNKQVQPTTFSGLKSEISIEAKNYNASGLAFAQKGQYQQAIENYNEAILLKPDYVDAWNNRAFAYLTKGDKISGCRDALKSCELGNCKTLEWARDKEYCH